jgi:tetratricopeptide (TPR) repeat protein
MKMKLGLCLVLATALLVTLGSLRGRADNAPAAPAEDPIRTCYRNSYNLEKEGKYADAIRAMQDVPHGYPLNLRLGWLSYLLKDYVAADSFYQAAIKMSPNSIEARLAAMLPLMAEKRWADAEVAARQIVRADPSNYYANLRLSYVLRWEGKFEQADEVATRMSNLYPTDTSYLLELAFARWGEKQNVAAKKLFNEVLILDPDNATAKAYVDKL